MVDKDTEQLLTLLLRERVLQFGDFVLKSGRESPYFFNLGEISSGSGIQQLGEAYARHIEAQALSFDVVFGPAYKGIPIAVATAEALARRGRDVGWAFNRKEAKGHGEGGQFVGAELTGRVLLVDDVLTAGTALREAAGLLRQTGAELAGVVIALDRQERNGEHTAVEALAADLDVPVLSLLTLQDVIEYLDYSGARDNHPPELLAQVRAYQQRYCELGPGVS